MATEKANQKNIESRPDEVPQSEPILASKERLLVGGIWFERVEMPEGDPPIKIGDKGLLIDGKRLDEEIESVTNALKKAIETGDNVIFEKMTGAFAFAQDEEQIDLYINLKASFKERDPKKLESINVDLLTQGIAERNLIREGLKPLVGRIPFIFKDRSGSTLNTEDDLDIVFVKDKRNSFKLIIGSKKGIDGIEVPDEIAARKLKPDLLNMEKDAVNDSITIPIKDSDNSDVLITSIEIRKGPINLPNRVAKEEAEEQVRKARKKQEIYDPPAARTPRRSSESGGYGYSSVSG